MAADDEKGIGGLRTEADLERWVRSLLDRTVKPGSTRTVSGIIDTSGSGSIVEGTGFTIARNGAGDITITFSTPFVAVPVVCATPGPTGLAVHKAAASTTSTARLAVFDSTTGADMDGIFDFVAEGVG